MKRCDIDTFDEEIFMDHVNICWFITEDEHRGIGFLETLDELLQLLFLLDVLDFLDDVEIDLASTSNVDNNWINECLLREILNFLWHCWWKQKSLSSTLFTFNKKAK